MVTITKPLLVLSSEQCWKCKSNQLVIAIAGIHVLSARSDTPYESGTTIMLTNIGTMPKEIADHLAAFHPPYQRRYSKTAKSEYFANTCSACGENFGDWFLFNEPEGAFFPMDEKQAKAMSLMQLPFVGEFDFHAGHGEIHELILDHAERIDR